METFNKIILAIPHDGVTKLSSTWSGDISPLVEKWTDTKTSLIFSPLVKNDKVEIVCHLESRFDCDVERLENDPLKKVGQGIYYTQFGNCKKEYKFSEHKRAITYWLNYRFSLVSALEENSLIIDCHSFPSEVCEDIDINIGFNEDFSKPSATFIQFLGDFFESYGYKVGINKPYSNSITPTSELAYKSIMIELNKKIYLDENGKLLSSAYKINQMLNYLYYKILGF